MKPGLGPDVYSFSGIDVMLLMPKEEDGAWPRQRRQQDVSEWEKYQEEASVEPAMCSRAVVCVLSSSSDEEDFSSSIDKVVICDGFLSFA